MKNELKEMIEKKYRSWLENIEEKDELKSLTPDEIEDSFWRELSFGTGGLRGVLGLGTNRMNRYTVAKASQGLANYVKRISDGNGSVAVSYDSRIQSDVFAKIVATVFAGNGMKVFLYKELMPTPCLSYATRELNCTAGVMITASHNPAKYNGYKVYNSDGCQITVDAADDIQKEINGTDIFKDVLYGDFDECLANGLISYVPELVYDNFIDEVKKQSVLFGETIDRNVSIVYTPLNGTGLKPVVRALSESGFTNVTIVKEQEKPDGNFPTCPYPNPEIRQAMELGVKYAEEAQADLLLATDPDCDRVGIAIRYGAEYRLLTGNEVGLLLFEYVCSQRTKHDAMPNCPILVKTIVTIDLAERIAEHYGVQVINVLTGFKFIGEQIGYLEATNEEKRYIFGFEESYGYLSGSYVRDKDAVNGAFLICEMFAYYKTRGISLIDKLEEIYKTYGYCLNTLHTFEFEGSDGLTAMNAIMSSFRNGMSEIAGHKVCKCLDYNNGIEGLPKSDVLKYMLDCGSVVIRPSGTEPKLKIYISVTENDLSEATSVEQGIKAEMQGLILKK